MLSTVIAYAVLAANPVGGLLVAVPYAVFRAHLAAWIIVLVGVAVGYAQVLVVDLGWHVLDRAPWWRRTLERRRSAHLERWVAAGRASFAAFVLSPVLGPWLVMALMRYAKVPQRRIAIPVVLSVASNVAVLVAGCVWAPMLFKH